MSSSQVLPRPAECWLCHTVIASRNKLRQHLRTCRTSRELKGIPPPAALRGDAASIHRFHEQALSAQHESNLAQRNPTGQECNVCADVECDIGFLDRHYVTADRPDSPYERAATMADSKSSDSNRHNASEHIHASPYLPGNGDQVAKVNRELHVLENLSAGVLLKPIGADSKSRRSNLRIQSHSSARNHPSHMNSDDLIAVGSSCRQNWHKHRSTWKNGCVSVRRRRRRCRRHRVSKLRQAAEVGDASACVVSLEDTLVANKPPSKSCERARRGRRRLDVRYGVRWHRYRAERHEYGSNEASINSASTANDADAATRLGPTL